MYAVDMGSDAMIYIPSFKKIGSAIQKLREGTRRQHGDRIHLLSSFSKQGKYTNNKKKNTTT
jgi:ADP-dependent phosphofructokinase/glucokinase